MCTFTVTVFACGHIADPIFRSHICATAQPNRYCRVFKWYHVRLKHWVCGACGGSGRALDVGRPATV
jgi:hypothetical protein